MARFWILDQHVGAWVRGVLSPPYNAVLRALNTKGYTSICHDPTHRPYRMNVTRRSSMGARGESSCGLVHRFGSPSGQLWP
jgi:hypothetical protein